MLTFALIAAILMPTGEVQVMQLGTGLTYEQCVSAQERTEFQLEASLSVAKLISVSCEKEVSV